MCRTELVVNSWPSQVRQIASYSVPTACGLIDARRPARSVSRSAVTDAKQKLIYRAVKRQSSIFGRQSSVDSRISCATIVGVWAQVGIRSDVSERAFKTTFDFQFSNLCTAFTSNIHKCISLRTSRPSFSVADKLH